MSDSEFPIIEVSLQPDTRTLFQRVLAWAWCGEDGRETPGFGIEFIEFVHKDYDEWAKRIRRFKYNDFESVLQKVDEIKKKHPTARVSFFGYIEGAL